MADYTWTATTAKQLTDLTAYTPTPGAAPTTGDSVFFTGEGQGDALDGASAIDPDYVYVSPAYLGKIGISGDYARISPGFDFYWQGSAESFIECASIRHFIAAGKNPAAAKLHLNLAQGALDVFAHKGGYVELAAGSYNLICSGTSAGSPQSVLDIAAGTTINSRLIIDGSTCNFRGGTPGDLMRVQSGVINIIEAGGGALSIGNGGRVNMSGNGSVSWTDFEVEAGGTFSSVSLSNSMTITGLAVAFSGATVNFANSNPVSISQAFFEYEGSKVDGNISGTLIRL